MNAEASPHPADGNNKVARAAYAMLPLVLLGVVAFGIVKLGPSMLKLTDVPDVEEISIQWITLKTNEIRLDIVNGGPSPVTIAQVLVDEAYWSFTMEPDDNTLGRLQRGVITIPYPWVEGETHEVRLISRNGVTFDAEIPVAMASPEPSAKTFGFFVLLGVIIGVVPVALGLMWYPLIGRLSESWIRFFLALTIGLLLYLVMDTLEEGLEIAETLPGAYQGPLLLLGVAFLVFAGLMTISRRKNNENENEKAGEEGQETAGGLSPGVMLAWLIALGIGLHNVGEGLAVGAAYVLGEVPTATALVLGFTLHNITEGLAIVTPVAAEAKTRNTKAKLSIGSLVGLGTLAGAPTIVGTLIGGFTYSNFWALIFFAVAAGAIAQVIYLVARSPSMKAPGGGLLVPETFGGLLCGLGVMYATGLLLVS